MCFCCCWSWLIELTPDLVYADPQGSALAWSSAREIDPIFPVVGMPTPTLHRDLPELARDYDHVVIDGAPRVNELGRAAIMASNLVVVPVQPSPYDVWASADIVRLIGEATQFRPALRAVFAINRKIVNTALGRDVVDALADYPIPVLKSAICQRIALAESAAQGQTVFETAPDHPAGNELLALVDEIMEFAA